MTLRAPLALTLAAGGLLVAAPLASAAPDRKVELGGSVLDSAWDGGPVTGTPIVAADDDDTLVTLTQDGRLSVTVSDASAEAVDLDLAIYRSDAAGEPKGDPVVESASETADEKVAKELVAGTYLVRVTGYASFEGTYKGKATFVPSAPAAPEPSATPAPTPAPSATPAPATDATPAAKLGKLPKTSRKARFLFKGTATDDKKVAKVEVAIVKTGRTCTQMTAKGRFTKLAKCAAPTSFLKAKGTKSWSFRIPKTFKKGTYVIYVRATDGAGQKQAGYSSTSRRTFKVK